MARARSLDLTPRVSPLAASLRMPASPSRAPASDVAPPAPEDVITRGLWNRARDLRCVRRHLGASEGGADSVVVRCARTDAVLARGYERLVLGDHGPYLELDRERVEWGNAREVPGGAASFYREFRAVDPSPDPGSAAAAAAPTLRTAKLYDQIRAVTGQRNPPRDSAWAVANDRPESEGYADYVPGRVYVACEDVALEEARDHLSRPPVDASGPSRPLDDAARSRREGIRKLPGPRLGGRVAWWKPAEGRGGIVPVDREEVRRRSRPPEAFGANASAESSPDPSRVISVPAEISVTRASLADGASTLVPGEGVWFDLDVRWPSDERREGPERSVGGSPVAPALFASNVTGPGNEALRELCPGAAEAEAERRVAARARSDAAREKKQMAMIRRRRGREGEGSGVSGSGSRSGTDENENENENENASLRSRLGEFARDLAASASRRVARILRDNVSRINREAKTHRGPDDSLPPWLAAVSRGGVCCPVGATAAAGSAAAEAAARAAIEDATPLPSAASSSSGSTVPRGTGIPRVVELTSEGLRALAASDDSNPRGRGPRPSASEAPSKKKIPRAKSPARLASALDDVLPVAGVGPEPLVVCLPEREGRGRGGRDSTGIRAAAAALRAAEARVRGVVIVSRGADEAVRDAVRFAGACDAGTPAFVPARTFAAVALPGEEEDEEEDEGAAFDRVERTAVFVTTFVREDSRAGERLRTAAGRAYCWRCGDATHRRSACPRRGGGEREDGRDVRDGREAFGEGVRDAAKALAEVRV